METTRSSNEHHGTVRHLYATVLRGEVSDATIQGYLRAASQVEDLWQQIDDRLAALITQGIAPWEAYHQLRYPILFSRAARTTAVFIKALLDADATFEPQTAGYLPRITYGQADALGQQLQPSLQYTLAALNDPNDVPDVRLPLALGPRVENDGRPCPVTHLEGIITAAREVREWAAGLIAQYEQAVTQASEPVPQDVTAHIATLHTRLAQADSQLRFGTDFAGQVTQGDAPPDIHMQAENYLWDAIQSCFLLNQAVAMPELLQASQGGSFTEQQGQAAEYRDIPITPDDLWRVAAPSARSQLQGSQFGEQEMQRMWRRMGGIFSAGVQHYLDDVDTAVARSDALLIAAMASCPYEPIYRTRRPLVIAGVSIPADDEFHWDFHEGRVDFTRRFSRTEDWQQCSRTHEEQQISHRSC